MPRAGFGQSLTGPKVDLMVDMGNPFLNITVDGFLKIGAVAVAKTAVEETYDVVKRGSISQRKLEHSLKKMCKEGAYWGTIAGAYVGMEYGVERIRGTRDWRIYIVVQMIESVSLLVDSPGFCARYLKLGPAFGRKNATLGGALTGALVSAASNNSRDKIVMDAITGGAIATAAEFINYLT